MLPIRPVLQVRPTNTSYFCKHSLQLARRLVAGILIGATAFLFACSTAESTADSMDSQTSTTQTSALPATTYAPVAMLETSTGSISELPVVNLAEANPAAPVDTDKEPTAIDRAICTADADVMQQRMLQLINEARSQPRLCGDESFSATDALGSNSTLALAAQAHAEDMAEHDFFSHTGSDGSSASDRVDVAGYRWQTVGENIAAGRTTATETVADWLGSPGHCANIMNPSFFEMAVSCVENTDTTYQRYWTQVFAAPR